MTPTSMTVAELINTYRLTNTEDGRREDPRHARWWVEHFGALPVSALTTECILRALDQVRADGRTGARAGATVALYLRFLRRVTAWGTCTAVLPADPCAGIPLPKEPAPPMRVVTEEEEAQLCQALGSPYSLWVRFAILTGLEQSEQFSLLWRSVDLTRGLLWIPSKTGGVVAELSLPPAAVAVLRALRHAYPTATWVFPDPQNVTRPADPHNFYVSRWARTIERLGLPHMTWKDLRHTCGVRLAKQGLPVGAIATFLRQRELRQAYRYRAWFPGESPKPSQPKPVRAAVFQELTDTDLQALLSRDIAAHPLTFGEVCRFYAAHHLRDRPGRRDAESLFRQFFQPWENRLLASISRREVRLFYMGLAKTPARGNKALGFIRCIYNWASNMDLYAGINPAVGTPRYRCSTRDRFLTTEEVQRFMAGLPQLPHKPRAYLLTLILTGCRRSEARLMKWSDVEWASRIWKKPTTKTGTPHFVPLPVQVIDAIQQLPRVSEWVFPGQDGQPWSCASIEKLWGLLRRRWNLESVNLHDLRRTCASYLAMSGENLPTIQNVLNHRSLAPTSIYARLNTKAIDRALQGQADRLTGLRDREEVTLLAIQ